jgi:hypothetical protein
MKKVICINLLITIVFLLTAKTSFAQDNMSYVISSTPTEGVPFNATKKIKPLVGYDGIVNNANNAIPDKLYDDVQCMQYTEVANSYELAGRFFRKFTLPNSSNALIAISFGHGYGESRTDVLCVVNPTGAIISTIECAIMADAVYVKQFRINAQSQIIISTIKPTSAVSLPESWVNFTGQRIDITYMVNAQGQFMQLLEQEFQPQNYTRTYLENKNVNIWEGGEIPL